VRHAPLSRFVLFALCAVACDRGASPVPAPSAPATTSEAPATASAFARSAPADLVSAPAAPPSEPAPPPPLADPIAALPPPLARDDGFRRGVSLGLFVSTEDAEWRATLYHGFLDEIAELGATDVQLVVSWQQHDVHATELAPADGVTVQDSLLAWVIDQARARQLRVFLMPTLRLAHRPRGKWRGKLAPSDWDAWWTSYRAFTLHYADLAQAHGVELLSVGSELVSTEAQTERWRALIAAVRARFRGQLTYSANWDHFEPVGFWDALDVAGITAYQELSAARHPTEEELVAGFAGLSQRVRQWSAQTGVRFLFTEMGYPSQPFGARYPWDYRKRGAPDPQLQLRCYRAFYRAWQAEPALAGLYVWNWFGVGGLDDAGYTPRGKPAAEVLRHWYLKPSAPHP